MKHINDNPFEFFQQGGWGMFLGGAGGVEVSWHPFCSSLIHERYFRATIHRSRIQSPSLKAVQTSLFPVPVPTTMPASFLKEVAVEVAPTSKGTMMTVIKVKALLIHPVSKTS
jgi:hypothetical protein